MPHNICDEGQNWMPEKILWRRLKTNLAPPDSSCFPNYCFT